MYPTTYTLERNGKFATVRTCGGPIGAARGFFRDLGKVSWKTNGLVTVINGIVTVTENKL